MGSSGLVHKVFFITIGAYFVLEWYGSFPQAAAFEAALPKPVGTEAARLADVTLRGFVAPRCLNTAETKVAIINDVPFHQEVVAGMVHVAAHMFAQVDVYLSHQVATNNFRGTRDLLEAYPHTTLYGIGSLGNCTKVNNTAGNSTEGCIKPVYGGEVDLVITISPEYRPSTSQMIIQKVKPLWVVAMIHNGNTPKLSQVVVLHRRITLVTLAPHVAHFVGQRINRTVDWILPVAPHRPVESCDGDAFQTNLTDVQLYRARLPRNNTLDQLMKSSFERPCFSLFAVQGNVHPMRRDYGRLWAQLANQTKTYNESVGVMVVGSMPTPQEPVANATAAAAATAASVSRVIFHQDLPYLQYYDLLHRSRGLLLLLASDMYLHYKASSTIITALTTQVPVVMTRRALTVYKLLAGVCGNVWVQRPGEDEVAAMRRLADLPLDQVVKARMKMMHIARKSNLRTQLFLQQITRRACRFANSRLQDQNIPIST